MHKFSGIYRHEPDGWNKKGSIFTSEENLKVLEEMLSGGQFFIAEHWHYRGARAPDRVVVEDCDEFINYLKENAIAGDIVKICNLTEAWEGKEKIMEGKCPDDKGEVPERGAY